MEKKSDITYDDSFAKIAKQNSFQNVESSSEEEDLNEDSILNQVFRNYSGDLDQLAKSRSFLENFFQSDFAICLICIETIKRTESIWSCIHCFCIFHLNCIKRWGNDSIFQQKLHQDQEVGYYTNEGEFVPKINKPVRWCCPKCRFEYTPDNIPKIYKCFCKKETNPQYHPWQIPHSCGERCENNLEPFCGHICLILCHPGPCPPCPQYISTSCKCLKSTPKVVRCFNKSWKCNIMCNKKLCCDIHKCNEICHEPGKCPPCKKKSLQKCECENESMQRNCSELIWNCKKACNKAYSCGLHKCKKICHTGDCGNCPLGLPRSCPCGKNKIIVPCSDVVEPCGDNCLKVLDCGIHYCSERCHKGNCSTCLVIIKKKCKCGLHTKELPCTKIFLCEIKCKLLKDCGKHVCNKKCCDGQCSPCDKICNKTLLCKKHKCKSVCHEGPCYPCELKSSVKCRCGNTSVVVPCGREKKTKSPKCLLNCRKQSKCHHENPHRCHLNECPPCTQICGLKNETTNCVHLCQAICHDAVKMKLQPSKSTNIWDRNLDMFEYKKLPHPKCEIPQKVTCIGGHETIDWPCWNSKPSSCGRFCQRLLKCSNHTCTKICHTVLEIDNKNEQDGCATCTEPCMKQRPEGCTHKCSRLCHPSPCDPCTVIIKLSCHCGLSQVHYQCYEFFPNYTTDKNITSIVQNDLKTCGIRCTKKKACGHFCEMFCHSGECDNYNTMLCSRKKKLYCDCRNLKKVISCFKWQNEGSKNLTCNDKCAQIKAKEEQLKKKEEERLKKIEDEKNRIELELFEKQFGGKKYHARKVIDRPIKQNSYVKYKISAFVTGIISIAVMIYLLY